MTTISDERLAEIGSTINFFASVIKSGETWTATCQRDFDNAHAALSALRAQGGVRVKPLEWGATSYGTPEATTVAGVYRITHAWDGGFSVNRGKISFQDEGGRKNFPNIEAAKAAAQADYERRILGALEASPAPVSEHSAVTKAREIGNRLGEALAAKGGQ